MIEKSFYLIRTNPALTTNVKLVITQNNDIYLESYSVNRTLSEERFKHFKINKDNWLFEEIPAFYTGVPAETAFYSKTLNDDNIMYDDFVNQFDDTYYSGASWTEDTYYEEEYEYIAPIWLKKDKLPESFIIFRVDGSGLTDNNNPTSFRSDILNKWKIVSYFDLTDKSDIGKYIRTQMNHELFPNNAMEVHFEDLRLSKFYGIDYEKSGYVSKSIHLENKYKLNTPIFHSEEYFTNQWKDLGLIFPFIYNFKFLFDDTPATPETLKKWSLNRYVGFYIDEVEEIKKVSPYQPFTLNKIPIEKLQQLTPEEVNEIPYLYNNTFVQDIGLRRFTFDPILGGWQEGKQYFIEWNGEFYRLERTLNDDDLIIGKYAYKVIAPINIEHSVPPDITNTQLQDQYKKVLINELNTLKHQIEIIDNVIFDNIVGHNIIEYTNTMFITFKRNFQQYIVHGQLIWGFTITLEGELNNNLFDIEHFDDVDLVWIEINNKKYVIKRYPDTIPNIGSKYYILSDEAIKINKKSEEIWINNGINTKDPEFYHFKNIERVIINDYPITYSISRASFLDVKDFDFDRIETKYTNYEYEKEDVLTESLEPKLYGKDRRKNTIKLEKPKELNVNNFTNSGLKDFLLSDPHSYTEWMRQYEDDGTIYKKDEITELYNKIYFDTYEKYIDFKWSNIINSYAFRIGNYYYNDPNEQNSISLTIKEYQKKLPLYINPTRIPVLDESGEQLIDSETGNPLWEKDYNGNYVYTSFSKPDIKKIDLNREWYREEGYILLQSDNENEQDKYIDFLSNSEPTEIKIKLPWDDPTNVDYRTNAYPMAYTMEWAPYSKSVKDPNETLDLNYVPVSSEYVTSEELFEIRNNNTSISPILNKNQYVCKWGILNSISHADYPYRLNYDLDTGGLYNMDSNAITNIPYAVRQYKDLDYFYRFGVTDLPENYKYYSLHLNEEFFNIDKYVKGEFDYFNWIFNTDVLTTNGLLLTKKYSLFSNGDNINVPNTVFKGIKYYLYDVKETIFNEEFLTENLKIVDDYVKSTSSKYNDYKFSIVLGRKLSIFENNAGDNDGDFGIDIYLNDKYKNVLVHLYFETDLPVTFKAYNENSTLFAYNYDNPPPTNKTPEELKSLGYVPYVLKNLETAIIDELYDADTIIDENTNINYWELGKIKINDTQQIGDIRIRDLRLLDFLTILNDYNYDPINGSGRKPIQYIHIYEDGTTKYYNTTNTDFILDFELPKEFLIKDKSYKVEMFHENSLFINNSIKNRIIIDDDPNNPTGDPLHTSKGALVNSITDINAWDGYPIARIFNMSESIDKRNIYDLNEIVDPKIYRHSGIYVPIFNDLQLFRPLNHWSLDKTNDYIPTLLFKNWKFYDDYSDNKETGPVLTNFGYINEIVYSKCNLNGNILKLSKLNDADKRSIYPMVDEYGYDVNQRYIFQSTWDKNFYIQSRLLQMPVNKYPDKSGYCVFFNGTDSKLVIEDDIKFNVVPEKYEYTEEVTKPIIVDFNYDGLIYASTSNHIKHEGNIYKGHANIVFNNGWMIFNGDISSRIKLNPSPGILTDFRIEVTFQLDSFNSGINTIYSFSNTNKNRDNEILMYIKTDDKKIHVGIAKYEKIMNHDNIELHKTYTFILERVNNIVSYTLNGISVHQDIYNDTELEITSGTIAQEQDSDWGGYNPSQSLIGRISHFQINTPDDLSELDIMNVLNDASLIPSNWTRGRYGSGSLTYNKEENALEYSHAGYSYFEYNTNIRVFPGQRITMSVAVKSFLEDDGIAAQVGQSFFCGIRLYGENYTGNTSADHNLSGDVGYNNGHVYFVASDVNPSSTNYSRYTETYTVPNYVTYGKPMYVRPMLLLNYFNGYELSNGKSYNVNNVNTMYIKDFTFKITNPSKIKGELKLFNLDFNNSIKFSLLNLENTSIIKYYDLNNDSQYNYIFSDLDGVVLAFNRNKDQIAVLTYSSVKYVQSKFISETNTNGDLYSLRKIQLLNNYPKTTLNSNISDNDIMFDVISKTKGVIQITYIIEDVKSFNIEDFELSMKKQLEPYYTISNISLNEQNIKYDIISQYYGYEYNFSIESYHNTIEDTSSKIIALPNTSIVEYSKIGYLKYFGENSNKTNFSNKAIKDITIEMWINVTEFSIENQTILHKGSLDDYTAYSWIIRRYKKTNKIEFVTRSYILTNPNDITNININTTPIYVNSIVSDFEFNDGLWHHIACVFDSKNHQKIIYVDGEKDNIIENINLTNIIIDPETIVDQKDWNINIGSDNNNGIVNFEGYIDELRIWNYARNEHEIYQNYDLLLTPTSYLNPFKSLIGYWTFDEQLGSLIYDKSKPVFEVKDIVAEITSVVNTGTDYITTITESHRSDIISLFTSNTNIVQDGSNIEWYVSSVNIRGISDDRYEVELPPSSITRKTSKIKIMDTTPSNRVYVDEIPPQPESPVVQPDPVDPPLEEEVVVPPVIPEPEPDEKPIIPAPPPVLDPPIPKIKKLPKTFFRRKRPIIKRKRPIDRKHGFRDIIKSKIGIVKHIKHENVTKQSNTINKIDLYSKIRKRLDVYKNDTEKLMRDERISTIHTKPVDILRKKTPVINKPNTNDVNVGKNSRNVIKKLNSLFFKPIKRINRRPL